MKWMHAYPFTESDHSHDGFEGTSFPAFAPILSEDFEDLTDLPQPTEVPAGTLMLEQGDQCKTVWLIRDGLVRLSHLSPEGRETTLGLRTAGWFGGAACLIMNTPNLCSVKAITSCIVSRIPAHEFNQRLSQNVRLMRHLISVLSLELITQTSAQISLMSDSAEQRLDSFMRERGSRHAQLKTLDTLPLLKQMELAQLLCITPEHLSRLMRRSYADAHSAPVHTHHEQTPRHIT